MLASAWCVALLVGAGGCGLERPPPGAATAELTWAEEVRLVPAAGASFDAFGAAVALGGGTALVGAQGADCAAGNNCGAASVFVQDGAGAWVEQQRLAAGDSAANDAFGVSVAADGDLALVGARWADCLAGPDCGAVYTFERDGAGAWSERDKLVASDGAARDLFGASLALAGDTAVVGADGADCMAGGDCGAAYLFVRDAGGVWSEQQKLGASDASAGDVFGSAVAIDADTVVVGAHGADGAERDHGAAYVFVRDVAGAWSEQQKLVAGDAAGGDDLGGDVAVSGDTAVASATGDDCAAGVNCGAAYVFTRDAAGAWTEQQKLTAADAPARAHFAHSVALLGDTALMGAVWADCPAGGSCGALYVHTRDPTGLWTEQQKLFASDAASGAFFGMVVALAGDVALVGASATGCAGGPSCGAAYVLRLGDCPGCSPDGGIAGDGGGPDTGPDDAGLGDTGFGDAGAARTLGGGCCAVAGAGPSAAAGLWLGVLVLVACMRRRLHRSE